MGTKLGKSEYPANHGPVDFQCFGPAATKDGEFDNVKIADLGCFNQGETDSNKAYHAAIVKSRKTGDWYVYFEWGRTGANKPTFQFVACPSEADAQREFANQLHEKNDKRGRWDTVAGIRTLVAKPGKDCYLVRPMAKRTTGLPDAKTITCNEGAKPAPAKDKKDTLPKKATVKVDTYTQKLLHDLSVATVEYTRGAMATDTLPTQSAIDEARDMLTAAQKRLATLKTDDPEEQARDADLNQLTRMIYSRIPKKKALHTAAREWILNTSNILLWTQDLDCFESALYANVEENQTVHDPYGGLPLTMEWIDPKSALGKFLYFWWPRASANRHGYLGEMKIKNMWKVDRHEDSKCLDKAFAEVLADKPRIKERPLFQPSERQDLQDASLMKVYKDTNTALLHHGTRSVNIPGILRESLRLPKQLVGVVITGAMFGGGVYHADDVKKSAGYTSLRGSIWSAGSGGVRGRDAFMFASDVVLGEPFVAPGPHGYVSPPAGHHCVFGKGGHSGVANNEWIVFKSHQTRLRYLVEFSA